MNTDKKNNNTEDKYNWFKKLNKSLYASSIQISEKINSLFEKNNFEYLALEELEEILISADFGIETSTKMIEKLKEKRINNLTKPYEIKKILAREIEKTLKEIAIPLEINYNKKPFIILTVGVNGSGKTTTAGKIANQLVFSGKKVSLVAADTFRAAAVEQLEKLAISCGANLFKGKMGEDASSVVFDSLSQSKKRNDDTLIIDTAGRLQTKENLMAELEKIVRVLKKQDNTAPHSTLLTLDSTVGQNAFSQVKAFKDAVNVSGLAITKLDGTAKGGVIVGLADKFNIPIHFLGLGEGLEDLRPFSAEKFANNLMNL